MEAMAAGLPVISTEVGGVSQLIEDGRSGMLVKKGDLSALSDAMRTLMTDNFLRARIKDYSRKRALEKFDSSTMARSYEKLFLFELKKI